MLYDQGIKVSHNLKYNDVLIDLLGFIGFRKDENNKIELLYPDYTIRNFDVTRKQIEMIENLVSINDLEIKEKFYNTRKRSFY